jgi:hypothetical protein
MKHCMKQKHPFVLYKPDALQAMEDSVRYVFYFTNGVNMAEAFQNNVKH